MALTPTDLAKRCAESINFCTTHDLPMDQASVLVTTPQGWKAPSRFPRGQIVQWKDDGTRVRYFPAVRVLAWLAASFPEQVKIAARVNGQFEQEAEIDKNAPAFRPGR